LLDTIPGIDEIAARALLAEIGTKMEQFPGAQQPDLTFSDRMRRGARRRWQ